MNGSLGSSPLFDLHRALVNKGYADPACSQVIDKAKVSYLFLNSVKERENVFLVLIIIKSAEIQTAVFQYIWCYK